MSGDRENTFTEKTAKDARKELNFQMGPFTQEPPFAVHSTSTISCPWAEVLP
jgi:hypothetical protein